MDRVGRFFLAAPWTDKATYFGTQRAPGSNSFGDVRGSSVAKTGVIDI
jgi:hypothetical protein